MSGTFSRGVYKDIITNGSYNCFTGAKKIVSSIFENVPKIFNYKPRQYGAAITITLRYIVCHGRVLDPPGA